jgi:hypothetical protein
LNLVVGAKVLLTVKLPDEAVDATLADKSTHDTPLNEPCNLKVLPPLDKGQLTKSKVKPVVVVYALAENLKISFPTQFWLVLNAEALVALASMELDSK